jgi:hypothetical protein
MAELMCPGCKADLEPGRPYCPSCLLTAVPRPAVAEPVPAAPRDCADPDCVHSGVLPAAGCRHCGRGIAAAPKAAAGVTLTFPWGSESLSAGTPLLIGRENSPLAERLARYPNVSRRHAELTLDGDAVLVTDFDSANGTFLNDERIAPREAVRARAGDRLRFAAGLVAEVRAGRERA